MIPSKLNVQRLVGACMLLIGISATQVQAQAQNESVLLKRAAELREAPGEASRSLAALAIQTPVTRLGGRQGAWIQVRTAEGATGWLHMFDVASAGNAAPSGSAGTGALRSITSFFNRGSAPVASNVTSTAGIRGLGAEDLANAQPNPAAVAQTDTIRVSAGEARQFAGSAALSSRAVAPLPEPAPPPAQAPGHDNLHSK